MSKEYGNGHVLESKSKPTLEECTRELHLQRIDRLIASTVKSLADEFLLRCSELESIMRADVPDAKRKESLRLKVLELEQRISVTTGIAGNRIGLLPRIDRLVRLKLKSGSVSTGLPMCKRRAESVSTGERKLDCTERIYKSLRPRVGRSSSIVSQVPHDRAFYKVNRVLDDLAAEGSLSNNQLNLNSMGLTDSHWSLLCRRTSCDLGRVCQVDMSDNNLTNHRLVIGLIQNSQHLTFVNLRGNKFRVDAVVAIAKALSADHVSHFAGVDIRNNDFSIEEVKNYVLVELDRRNRIGSVEDVTSFRNALGQILIDKKTTCLDLITSA